MAVRNRVTAVRLHHETDNRDDETEGETKAKYERRRPSKDKREKDKNGRKTSLKIAVGAERRTEEKELAVMVVAERVPGMGGGLKMK